MSRQNQVDWKWAKRQKQWTTPGANTHKKCDQKWWTNWQGIHRLLTDGPKIVPPMQPN